MKVSVILTAYTDEKLTVDCVQRIHAWFDLKKFEYEVLIIPGGFKNLTQACLKASGKHVLVTDPDLPSPIKESDKLFEALEAGCDFAVGSRWKSVDVQMPPITAFFTTIANFLTRLFILPGIHDSRCRFRAFTRQAAVDLLGNGQPINFAFGSQIIRLAKKKGFRVREVPVMWREKRG